MKIGLKELAALFELIYDYVYFLITCNRREK